MFTFRLPVVLLLFIAMIAAACSSSGVSSENALTTAEDAASEEAGDSEDAGESDEPAESENPESEENPEPEEVPADADAPRFAYQDGNSSYIYDQEALHTFELTLSEENLAFLDSDPTLEEYVEGDLTFEGETIENVGIRYKGSIGAFVGCLSGANPLSPSGEKTCTKLSMKVKFNFDGSDQEFFGLKKLQLHSQNFDPTQMHDRLGYHLFREMGVPAPRASHARLVINGEYVGLFAMIEQIDGRFTREAFDDGKGNLYKEVWPINLDGEVLTDEEMLEGLKTNENEDPSFAILQGFATEVNDASPEDRPAVIEKWMDVEQTISYVAVDRTIRHDDGPFHFYCFETPCWNHNFYLYEETDQRKVHIIPWDLDNAFENIMGDANPVTPIADAWGETQGDCKPFPYGAFNVPQISAACDPIIGAWASFDEEYDRLRTEFIEGPFAAENVDPLLDTWADQIRDSVIEASELHDDALTLQEWEAALTRFRESLEVARTS